MLALETKGCEMFWKPPEEINADDLVQVVAQRTPESEWLDYKRDRNLGIDPQEEQQLAGREKFLRDVCAMANNWGGGWLIIGVTEDPEEEGRPGEIVGASGFNHQIAEHLIRDSIRPPLGQSCRIRPIDGPWGDPPVYVVRIQRTWNRPHMAQFQGKQVFYSRAGRNTEKMTHEQIRQAFLDETTLSSKIEQFHRNHVGKVKEERVTFPVAGRGRAIIHVIPLLFFGSGRRLALNNLPPLRPIGPNPSLGRSIPNLHGRIIVSSDRTTSSYLQLFRNGAVEGVVSRIRDRPAAAQEDPAPEDHLDATRIEEAAIRCVRQARIFFASQSEIDESAYAFFLSVVDAKRSRIYPPPDYLVDVDDTHQIEHDDLYLPSVYLESLDDTPAARELREVFDILWQTSGWERSPNSSQVSHRLWR